MFCPVCKSVTLLMTEKQGVEIDYCPQCRGVWLDRGELDKIIERSEGVGSQAQPAQRLVAQPVTQPQHQHYKDSRYGSDDYKKKKRSSLLSELFDF
ncbi:TFIIB-type zinc ribbon-containing protein [Atopomonas sediminilitoris]|uniref:TFIIB-type zinc ribbon-containing protein n=1 Tax=Atopomonas sediminilitoris TaxID=2919919 RepID=UPI001F4ECBC1|nr:zf-TFIIB domain-containing protein [Atopomonas sediminilitoris]MCJ8168162.1 zf-TFIIB domain-containing protein [Atopomonas sediminilitoris]